MKDKYVKAHMKAAQVYAELSHCVRSKVGCIIVKDDSVIAFGYNGTPPGDDNCCEDERNVTKPNVIHAEDNALRKLTKSTESANGATMFITLAPCDICAPRIVAAGIKKVYYSTPYRCTNGIEYLTSRGVEVEHLEL